MEHDAAGRLEGQKELAELASIVSWAFGSPEEKTTRWLNKGGIDNLRVVRSSGRVIAGLLEVPMGQWFFGRSVPLLGIAGVAVAPDARGQGVAHGLMQRALRAARARGFALSALYPSTNTLYRGVGYELAGAYFRYSMRASDCPQEKSDLSLTLLAPEQYEAVAKLYAEVARMRSGYLDRGNYVWNRVREPQERPALGVGVHGSEGIEGYAYMTQRTSRMGDYDLELSDLVATTPRARSRLLSFLAEHRSTAGNVVWHADPADANLLAFKERVFSVSVEKHWMLRVVDLSRALELRGYPAIDAEVQIELEDELLPENTGVYRLTVQQGAASVERARGSAVRLGPRAFAALYSGFVSTGELERAGLVSGEPAALRTLSLLFSGPAPAMVDFF